MTLKERRAKLTRDAILVAARRLFSEAGYASTAVRPIADASGVALQTLYATFGSKQGILIALVDTIREQTNAPAMWDRIEQSDDPDQIVHMAAHLRRVILERCGDIIVTFREGAAGDRHVAVAYEEGQARNRQGITRMCARLGALGVAIDEPRAVDQVAAMFSAEIFEELTGPRSNWSADEYETWMCARLQDILLSRRNDT